jgi:hypothetical protein
MRAQSQKLFGATLLLAALSCGQPVPPHATPAASPASAAPPAALAQDQAPPAPPAPPTDAYGDLLPPGAVLRLGSQRFRHPNGVINAVAFLPDGARVVSASDDKTLRIWSAATGQELQRFEGHTDEVSAMAVSADGSRILSGSHDTTVRLWSVATGQEIRRFEGNADRQVELI